MGKNKESDFGKYLGLIGITVVSGGLLLGVMPIVSSAILNETDPYYKMSEGLPLSKKGIHLRAGNHNVIITDSFYDNLDKDNQFRSDMTIKGLQEAYEVLNKYNLGLNFNLCTTNPELSNRYYIPMAENIANDDIYIYGTNNKLLNKDNIIGLAEHDLNTSNYELNNLKITFRLDKLYKVWHDYTYSVEKTLSIPHNSAMYSCAVHETMHIMGFKHIEDRDSILNPTQNGKSKEINEEDIKLLDKYNVQFYNTKSLFEENTEDYSLEM